MRLRLNWLVLASGLTVFVAGWPVGERSGTVDVQAQGRGGTPAWEYGSVTPLEPDARGWGWQSKSYVSPDARRPFYNIAKERLFNGEQSSIAFSNCVSSRSISVERLTSRVKVSRLRRLISLYIP